LAASGDWLPLGPVAAGSGRPAKLSYLLNQEARVAWTVKVTDEYAAWFTALIKQELDRRPGWRRPWPRSARRARRWAGR